MRKMFVIRLSIPKKMLRFGLAGEEQWILGKEHRASREEDVSSFKCNKHVTPFRDLHTPSK